MQILISRLPDGWERRRVLVSHVGRLRVWAASRLDLLVMKVIAGRAQDIEDVRAMRVRFDELGFIRSHLAAMRKATPGDTDVAEAIELLEALEVHEHE